MPTRSELDALIVSIIEEQRSGVLLTSGEQTGSAGTKTYSLRFETGQLTRADGPDQLRGEQAVIALHALGSIAQFRWMPLASNVKWSGNAVVSAIALMQLFSSENPAIAPGRSDGTDANQSIVNRVTEVFAQCYVGDAQADLARVRREFPPELDAQTCLNACIELLTPWVVAKEARNVLKR